MKVHEGLIRGGPPLSEIQVGSADESARPAAIRSHHGSSRRGPRAATSATSEERPGSAFEALFKAPNEALNKASNEVLCIS